MAHVRQSQDGQHLQDLNFNPERSNDLVRAPVNSATSAETRWHEVVTDAAKQAAKQVQNSQAGTSHFHVVINKVLESSCAFITEMQNVGVCVLPAQTLDTTPVDQLVQPHNGAINMPLRAGITDLHPTTTRPHPLLGEQ
jgi:hypothetical protein